MSARAVHLVIDARPRGPHGPLAAEVVLGKSVLHHLLDLAVEHVPPGKAVVVHARGMSTTGSASWLPDSEPVASCSSMGRRGPTRRSCAPIAFTTRARLRRGLRRGRSPESAVIWRLDRPESLSTADQELTRRLTYQPLGKYWAFPLARRLAERLCPTSVTPNTLTLGAGILMLSAAALDRDRSRRLDWPVGGCVLARAGAGARHGRRPARPVAGDQLGIRPVARPGSRRAGRHGPPRRDRLGRFRRDGQPLWLVLGIIYASGKYLFVIQSLLGDELEKSTKNDRARCVGAWSTAAA